MIRFDIIQVLNKARKRLLIAILIIVGYAVITAVIGWDDWLLWLIFLSVATGTLINLYSAEGYWICFVFSIISYALYIPFCVMERYHGELIVSVIVIAANIITLFKWKRNTNNKTVKINKLGKKEVAICALAFVIATVAGGFAFWAVDTPYPFLNSVCVISVCFGIYFAYRISRNEFVMNLINAAAYLTLWLIAAVNGDWGYVLFSIGGLISLGYSVYGFIRWGKLYKKQISN